MSELGPLSITLREAPYVWEGQPAAGGERQSGVARVAAVTGPGGIAIDLAVIVWPGSKEVAALDCYGSPPRIQRLGRGGRIGIRDAETHDHEWMELRISRLTSAEWSSEFQTTVAELSTVCRLDASAALRALGATGVGTRHDVLADEGRRKNEVAVRFPAGSIEAPLGAYCLVRVLPLLYGFGQDNASLVG